MFATQFGPPENLLIYLDRQILETRNVYRLLMGKSLAKWPAGRLEIEMEE
jgi:hypothetical protein